MIALKGPFLGRFPIRSSLSLSSFEIFLRLSDVEDVVLEVTAGTAERWARIFAEVSCENENFGSLLRTMIGYVQCAI